MGTATGMIKAARGLLGTYEHPMGSNYVPGITDWYNTRFHIGTTRFSWCDASVTKEADESDNADAVLGGKGFAYVPAHAAWFKARGRFHSGASGMRPGDVVFYNWAGRKGTTECDHVGVCEKDLGDGTFYVLEGNHDDRFQRVHRDSTYISGYGRPAYAGTASKEDPLIGLKKGDKGEAVTGLQTLLVYAGHEAALGKAGVDGEYGDATAEALRLVRKDMGSSAGPGYGDEVTGWAYGELMAAAARKQGHA